MYILDTPSKYNTFSILFWLESCCICARKVFNVEKWQPTDRQYEKQTQKRHWHRNCCKHLLSQSALLQWIVGRFYYLGWPSVNWMQTIGGTVYLSILRLFGHLRKELRNVYVCISCYRFCRRNSNGNNNIAYHMWRSHYVCYWMDFFRFIHLFMICIFQSEFFLDTHQNPSSSSLSQINFGW